MKRHFLTAALALFAGAPLSSIVAAEARPLASLQAMPADSAREQAWAWLRGQGKSDDAIRKQFDAIWADASRSVCDRIADSLALGDADAARLLKEARDTEAVPPTEVPAFLKDARRPVFFRANFTLAYARALANREVYEEALAALRLVRPGDVADPAAYHFHRAVAEHGLGLKRDAARSLAAVRDDVEDVPLRYQRLADLMEQEMGTWRNRDLGDAARRMKNSSRRLGLGRADGKTQKIQHQAAAILDDIIRQMERELPVTPTPGGGGPTVIPPPEGGGGNGPDGPGIVPDMQLPRLAQQWGKLPDRERAQAMQGLIRGLPPEYREVIERYFRELAKSGM
jgi:hypothetical protein